MKSDMGSSLLAIPLAASMFLTGCLEEEGGGQNYGEQLEGQRFDIARIKEFVEEEKEKLAAFQKAAADSEQVAIMTKELEKVSKEIETAKTRNSNLADEIELTSVEFSQYQSKYRKMVRDAMVGTKVDLSLTKGDDYKEARVLGIDPTAIKVYRSSGPEGIPIKDLPSAIVEKLQMDEEEAASYLEKLAANEKVRAKQFAQWKEKQSEKQPDVAVAEVDGDMKEIRVAIFEREQMISRKIQEIKAWKSKASQLDARAADERASGRRHKSERLAELARDKADILADENADSWVVIERLKAQLQYLTRIKEGQKPN